MLGWGFVSNEDLQNLGQNKLTNILDIHIMPYFYKKASIIDFIVLNCQSNHLNMFFWANILFDNVNIVAMLNCSLLWNIIQSLKLIGRLFNQQS